MLNDDERSRTELERALRETRAYRDWQSLDPGPSVDIDERYAALPITTKADLRRGAPRALVPGGQDLDAAVARGEAELVTTSGTTGTPTTLVWSQRWWDASEALGWPLNANLAAVATGRHSECVLASARCVGPPPIDRPRSMAERTLGRLLFLNETADLALWSDADVRRMADELAGFEPAILEADSSYLAAFCARAEAQSLPLFRPRCIVLTYGRPSALHLARIRRAFGAPIVSSYGSTETGYVFVSCERGTLHQNVASCRVELTPLAADPRVGKLVITPFGHPFMCLLRYDVGDLVRLSARDCACGRDAGVALDDILGRAEDVSLTRGGDVVTAAALDEAVAAGSDAEEIVTYQIDQDAPGTVRLRAVAMTALDGAALTRRLRILYGGEATVERADALEPRPSGKYPYLRRGLALELSDRFGRARSPK